MSYEPSQHSPLEVSNPKRQATDTIRGYEYQIWQSVLRWVTLKADETLFLEMAEDFDVTQDGTTETTQVKDTARSGSVTLNSPAAIESISNFWKHQQTNPNEIVRFRLLTTSTRGFERSNPFNGVKGLDYWDRCKGTNTDLAPLRDFLAQNSTLAVDVRQFVSTASNEDLRNKLIRRIEWASDQGDHEAILELVKRRVVEHGITVYSLQPSESEKVVPALYTHVLEVVRKDPNRHLTLADFARIFEAQVTIRLTPQQIQELKARAGSSLPLSKDQRGSSQVANSFVESIEDLYDLTLLENMLERARLVSDLQAKLTQGGVLVLKGSTGMGKSILAILIASKEFGRWKRLDCRNLKPDEIKERLAYATLLNVEEGVDSNYIIDDLNFNDHPSTYERSLGGFFQSVVSRGGRIVLTTQGEIPTRLNLAFDLSEDFVCDVPSLTGEEIKELVAKHGCPKGALLESWGRIIGMTTSGHPQLVHARVKKIAGDRWPLPKFDHVLKDTGADQVRQEVRRHLQDYVPSEEARTLAYRLSVYVGPFKRSQALHLAGPPQAIRNAGEAFDFLAGPWIESYGRGYYKLSPLLKNSAQEMFDRQAVINLHKTAAYSFFVDRVLTQTEINGILFHGLVGQTPEPLQRIAEATDHLPENDWASIAREIEWFAHLAIETDTRLFESNPLTSLTLRRFQFRVAAENDDPEQATKVVLSWERELLRFDEFKQMPKFIVPRLALQQMFNLTFLRLEVPIPIRTIVRNIVATIALGKQWEAVADTDEVVQQALEVKKDLSDKLPKDQMQMLHEELGSDLDKVVDISDDVYFAAVRCRSAQDVLDFIDELEALASDAADEVWSYLGSNEFTAIMLVNAAWLSEVKAASPDWQRVLDVLDRVAEVAMVKHADHLVAGAFRSKAIVLKEYAKDKGDALAAIYEGVEKLGYAHPALQDYLAKIQMLDGQFDEAIRTWRQISPESESRQTTWRIFSHRDAVICAGILNDWPSVSEFALQGEKIAQRLCHMGETVAVGYLAEHALAVWKSGDSIAALNEFTQIVDRLKTLPDPNMDMMSYALHGRVFVAIRWLTGNVDGGEIEPQLGIFSDPSTPDVKREQNLPRPTFYVLMEAQLEMLTLKYSLRCFAVDSMISQYVHFSRLSKDLGESQTEFIQAPAFNRRMIMNLVFAAVVNWIDRRRPAELPLSRWREDAEAGDMLDADLACFFDFLEEALRAQEEHLRKVLDEPVESSDNRLMASLLLSASDSVGPEDRFVANLFLVLNGNAYSMWREETENIVADLIAKTWTAVVEQNVSLLASSTSAPRIISATRDTSTSGIRKASRILLAALWAVNVRLQDHTVDRLMDLAQ
jgi:hypothetical protein